MRQELHVIDYAAPQPDAGTVSPQKSFLTCSPGIFAVLIYVVHQYQDVPSFFGYLFWPLMFVGVVIGIVCSIRFRRCYRGRSRPWFVSLNLAVHTLVLLIGVPFLLLLIIGALTGNLL